MTDAKHCPLALYDADQAPPPDHSECIGPHLDSDGEHIDCDGRPL